MILEVQIAYNKQLYNTILFFFFNDTATTEIYTLSLHDALPICPHLALLLGLLAPLPRPGFAQALEKLTPERLAADPPLAGVLPTDLRWHPDGRRLTYLRKRDGASDLVALDAVNGHESVVLTASTVTIAGDPSPIALSGYAWAPSGDRLLAEHK